MIAAECACGFSIDPRRGAWAPNPLCPVHGDGRDNSILTPLTEAIFGKQDVPTFFEKAAASLHVLPGDVLLPPPSVDPDVVRLLFTVHISREGFRRYLLEYPGFAGEGEGAFETLAREAIAAWDSENLLDEGEPEVRRV